LADLGAVSWFPSVLILRICGPWRIGIGGILNGSILFCCVLICLSAGCAVVSAGKKEDADKEDGDDLFHKKMFWLE